MSTFPPPPPAPDEAPTTCFHHPDRVTGRKCTRCGRPACPDCLHQASVGSHCWQCIKAAAPPRSEQIRRAMRGNDLLVTYTLLALNTAMFVVSLPDGGLSSRGGAFHGRWALFAPAIDVDGEWYRLVTSGFVHFGILHIAMNMYVLYQLGLFLERSIGRLRFAVIYGVALLGGSAGALLLDPLALTAGASGAVFGLAAASIVAQRQRGRSFASTAFGPFLILNFVLSITLEGVSLGGHLGGAVLGALCGFALLAPYQDRRRTHIGYAACAALAITALAVAVLATRGTAEDFCRQHPLQCSVVDTPAAAPSLRP